MHWWSRFESLEAVAGRLARLGFDGIELECEPSLTDGRSLLSVLRRNGIECCGGTASMVNGRDLLHADKSLRAATVEYIKDCAQFIGELGGKTLTFAPAAIDRLIPGRHVDEWTWCIEGLRECQEFSSDFGVRIAIEPINRFRTFFINRCEQALKLAQEVGGTCGVCLDMFHMNIEESDWRKALHLAGPKLLNFHVADNNRLAPGQGAIDWPAVARELEAVDYRGYVVAELLPTMDFTPPRTAVNIASGLSESYFNPSPISWDDLASTTITALRTYFGRRETAIQDA